MGTESNKDLVRKYWEEVWNRGNLDLIEELFAPDLWAHQKTFIGKTRAAFADSRVTIDDMIAEGDKVVTRYSWRAVHEKAWDMTLSDLSMRVDPTGQAVWDRGIAIHQIAEGKIIASWSEWTKLELAQQLGAIAAHSLSP